MSETLKVVFQADDAELQSALQRNSRRLDDFDKRFAKRRDALPVSATSFTGWEQSATKAAKATRELEHAGYRAGKGGMAGSFGFLAFSQAVEDAQYGIRGVLNNIPQMVIGFGGSMGLAGGISLAAVALTQIIPLFRELWGMNDEGRIAAVGAEWQRVFDEGMKAARSFEAQVMAEREAAAESARHNTILEARAAILQQIVGGLDDQLKAARAARDAEEEILRARQSAVSAGGGNTSGITSAIQGAELSGIDDDARNRLTQITRLEAELVTLRTKREELSARTSAAEMRDTDRLIQLKKDLAAAEANVKSVQFEGKEIAERSGSIFSVGSGLDKQIIENNKNLAASLEVQKKIQQEIAEIEARRASVSGNKKFIADLDEQIAAAEQKLKLTKEEAEALAQLRKQRETIQKIENQEDAIKRSQERIAALQNESSALTRQSETADKQIEASSALAEELSILQQKLGLTKEARDVLDEEVKLRREAAGIAKEAGIDEDVVLQALKQRAAAQQQLAKQTPKGTLREQGDARRAERAERRAEERNQRQAEARARQKERNERNNERKLDQDKQKTELEKAREALEKEREKLRKEQEKLEQDKQKTLEESKAIQERIQEAISKISAA